MSILDLFCSVDAFWQRFEPQWERELLASGQRRRRRATRLHPAEILTILILFQQSGYRTLKGFSLEHVQGQLRQEFPRLVTHCRAGDSSCSDGTSFAEVVAVIRLVSGRPARAARRYAAASRHAG